MTTESDTKKQEGGMKDKDRTHRRNTFDKRHRGRGSKKDKRRRERVRPEFEHRVIDVRRVARVMKGGRRFSFSVVVVAGDRKGRVGAGVGKASDTANAIDKGLRDAKKSMITLNLTKEQSIPHEVEAKYASAVVKIFPAPGKGGAIAGGAVRSVLELAGVRSVGAKIISRSKNKLNNTKATLKALKKLQNKTIAKKT